MLVRGFPPTYLVGLLLVALLLFSWSFTYGAPRVSALYPTGGDATTSKANPNSNPDTAAAAASSNPQSQSSAEESGASVPDVKEEEKKVSQQTATQKVFFDWKLRKEDYPIPKESLIPLPAGPIASIPKIQHTFEPVTDEEYNRRLLERRDVIRGVLARCWTGYKSFAYGKDELAVESAGWRDHFGGWGATLVDSLDTLWITEMKPEFEEALLVLKDTDFSFSGDLEINTFETNIRYLGGLLAVHDLTNGTYPVVLEKAVELADLLYASFDTPNRMPITRWPWRGARDGLKQEALPNVLLAELGSFSLEFTRLTQLTNDTKYYDAVQRVSQELADNQQKSKLAGLWPVVVNAKYLDNFVERNQFTLSAMADSAYEYLPKQFLLIGGQIKGLQTMYEKAIDTAKANLFYRPMTKDKRDILISGSVKIENSKTVLDPEGQHLACYIPGMLAIGSKVFNRPDDLEAANKLLDGCLWASENTPTGIMPEVFHTIPCKNTTECEWDQDVWFQDVIKRHQDLGFDKENVDWKVLEHRIDPGFADIPDRRYILRPELIESIFILYRITGSETLRDRAWSLFETIEKITKTRYGSAAVGDVTTNPPEHTDFMESFWTAETLKYFYLMFSDQSVLSLDEWVFNTEAHPFRRPV